MKNDGENQPQEVKISYEEKLKSMKDWLKEVITIFFILTISDVIIELWKEEKSFMKDPMTYFGITLIASIITGSIFYWVKWFKNRGKSKDMSKLNEK